MRQILSSEEKKGSKFRLSKGSRRQIRLVIVLMVDALTYRVIGAVRRVETEEVRRGRELLLMRGEEREGLERRDEMQERAESCTGQWEESMASVHSLDSKGSLTAVEGGQEREARIVESRLRRETLKLSLALSLNEAEDTIGQTNSSDWSAVKSFIVTIFPRNMAQAVAILPF